MLKYVMVLNFKFNIKLITEEEYLLCVQLETQAFSYLYDKTFQPKSKFHPKHSDGRDGRHNNMNNSHYDWWGIVNTVILFSAYTR